MLLKVLSFFVNYFRMLRDIASLSDTEIAGLIEFLSSFKQAQRIELLNQVLNMRTRYFTVLLENLSKPHNASAVIRSCECFGIQDVHFVDDSATYAVNEKVVMGASKWLTLTKYNQQESNIHTALHGLKQSGYRLVATVPRNNASTLQEFDIDKGPAVFIFGTELTGVSDDVIQAADEFVHIPMVGFTESLNISVSAAILLQSLTAKLHSSKIEWQLSKKEKQHLMLNWLRKDIPRIATIENRYFKGGKNTL